MAITLRIEVPLTHDSDNTHPEPMIVEAYGGTVWLTLDTGDREISISSADFEAIAQLVRKGRDVQ